MVKTWRNHCKLIARVAEKEEALLILWEEKPVMARIESAPPSR